MSEEIVRIAARGDGVTGSGRHFAFAAPGDRVTEDGLVEPGPHRKSPPCRHFPECGGCQLQHVDDAAYREYLVERVHGALVQHGLETEIHPPHLSPPRSRRRASLRALKVGKSVAVGFNAQASHRVVDMHECHVLRPELFALIAPVRALLASILPAKRAGGVQLTLCDQGVDLGLSGVSVDGLEATEALTAFAEAHGLARLVVDEGFGPETRFEPRPATVTLWGTPVALPPGAFLQATADGEAALVGAVGQALAGSARTADLFAGLGTFAFALSGEVHAVEAGRDSLLALKTAAHGRVSAEHRDLYRRPLTGDELRAFDGVVLDPPRAGAAEQVAQLAGSQVPRLAYVSCNPATFARDARVLVDGGYRLTWVRPVGQFRWSTHIELAAAFAR